MRTFLLLAAVLGLAQPVVAQPGPASGEEWERRPPTVSAEEAGRDPAGATRRAIAAGDWRPFSSLTWGSHRIDGLDCAIPLRLFMFSTVVRQLPHSPPVPGEIRPVPPNLVSYNRALLAAPGSPLVGICKAAEGMDGVRAVMHEQLPRPWGMLAPLPGRRATFLLEAARWGRAAEAASFPVDPVLPKDVFHMNALAWAVVHGDAALVRRIMAARPDNRTWCAAAQVLQTGFERHAANSTDPLVLAAEAGRADFVTLIAPVFSQSACASANAYHAVYQDAVLAALARRDEAVTTILLAHYGPVTHQQRGDLARRIEGAGLGRLAADYYYAAAEIAYDHPLSRASDMCDVRAATFWAAESLRHGRPDDLAYAWDRMQRNELNLSGYRVPPGHYDCAEILDLYRSHGLRLAPDSPLLHWAVYADRRALSHKASRAEAERFLAAWRRLGGRLDLRVAVHCPGEPRQICTAGELARGVPRSSVEVGETIFADLLPPTSAPQDATH